jgi:broad specificity phosphatase PhoE
VTLIYLARHGETEWNADRRIQGYSDSPLNELGHRQALALAERLRNSSVAMATAAPTANFLDLKVHPMTELRERGYGEWEGKTINEVAGLYPDLWHRYNALKDIASPIPGGEEWSAVYKRVVSAMDIVLHNHRGDKDEVLIVGHGGSLRIAVLHALGAPLSMITRLKLDNASLCCVEYKDAEHGRVTFMNDTCHLDGVSV